jgi:hypothetical protein
LIVHQLTRITQVTLVIPRLTGGPVRFGNRK